MEKPNGSIIASVYKWIKVLKAAHESVKVQTFHEWEGSLNAKWRKRQVQNFACRSRR